MAEKLRSVLSFLVAIPRNCLRLQKKFSTRWRQRYHYEITGNFGRAVCLFCAGCGLCAALLEFPAKAIIVETLVADQRAEGDAEEQGFDRDAVMALPGQEDELAARRRGRRSCSSSRRLIA